MDPTTLDFAPCRLPPYAHQKVGVGKLVSNPFFALFDEMGAGKTKQVIDAAQFLYENKEIDKVIIVAPAAVREVWFDDELGELQKHLWGTNSSVVAEYHSKIRTWGWNPSKSSATPLHWIITNYEFLRSKARLQQLKSLVSYKTLLVLDESSLVKNHTAQQSRACLELRGRCGRVVILNGTPIANNPMDLFSQSQILSKSILPFATYYQFRARYAVMGGFQGKQIIAFQNLPELQQLMSPYVLRRLKVDCIDLPPKIDSVAITATLSSETWNHYKSMRDDMVTWLNDTTVSAASQAMVKGMRLQQITAGFLGGVVDEAPEGDDDVSTRPDWLPFIAPEILQTVKRGPIDPVQYIGREKVDAVIEFLKRRLESDPGLKFIIWSCFRPEVTRMIEELQKIPGMSVGAIHGGQKREDREAAIRLLTPSTMPTGPAGVVGTPATGSMGLNLVGADTVIYMSNNHRLMTRKQSEDRAHRPGQVRPVSYFDVMAVGPTGQKTIDHVVIKALRSKDDIATWTTSAWLDAIRKTL